MSDQVSQKIVEIAERLGFAADRIWPQVVMITYIRSWFLLIVLPLVMIASLAVAILSARKGWQCIHAEGSSMDAFDDRMTGVMMLLPLMFALGVAVIATAGWLDALAGVLYPEGQTVLKLAGR